ncbi:hypothetical protein FRAAL0340 [Frankia alni ACN14a]|uniref:Uncharacterized protein n=1 Tax=Frankia alni (strain DSM 45986 / CECT 9034 / ACN14a) TaxID=326424 RepID=Q0RTT2_FRAAA|nr:hypothetical protein FRAAL0340 [Frankia alni ACN14a]
MCRRAVRTVRAAVPAICRGGRTRAWPNGARGMEVNVRRRVREVGRCCRSSTEFILEKPGTFVVETVMHATSEVIDCDFVVVVVTSNPTHSPCYVGVRSRAQGPVR